MRALLCWLYVAGAAGGFLPAQEMPVPMQAGTSTLHVYTDLMQIPVLVLGPDRRRLTSIAAKKFTVSLDSGPWFRATHVRQEGDDPISLSIVLDLSGADTELMPKIDEAIARLAPLSLHPQDHISIYALDCSLVRFLDDAPADPELLKMTVERALASWNSRGRHREPGGCIYPSQLWDTMAFLSNQLYRLPGRRVLLGGDGRKRQRQQTYMG